MLVIGYSRRTAAFCTDYRVVARISTAGSDERGNQIAGCTLRGALRDVWPLIVAGSG